MVDYRRCRALIVLQIHLTNPRVFTFTDHLTYQFEFEFYLDSIGEPHIEHVHFIAVPG